MSTDKDYTCTTTTESYISDAEVWLRCFTARMVNESSISCNASYADKALEEYKKRYGDEISGQK